jgi:Fe2+ or Zn2+ uptake regulation protein
VNDATRRLLEERGIRPSAHRIAVTEYVLHAEDHPTADRVWKTVADTFPAISRATVYNTLNLLVEKGMLRKLNLQPDCVVFDPNLATHHHFIDDDTGEIRDVAFDEVQVSSLATLQGYRIDGLEVVLRGHHIKEPGSPESRDSSKGGST